MDDKSRAAWNADTKSMNDAAYQKAYNDPKPMKVPDTGMGSTLSMIHQSIDSINNQDTKPGAPTKVSDGKHVL